MKSVFWVNFGNLSKEAVDALREIIPDVNLIQLNDVSQDEATSLLAIADFLAFQKGSLPPELDQIIRNRRDVIEHETDFNSNFVEWSWYN